jgi:hypothetical protein
MSLPTLSSNSKRSDEKSDQRQNKTPPAAAGRAKGSRIRSQRIQSKKDDDLPVKLQVASALSTSGHYARINVVLSAISSRGLADVTDVDVLGIRYDFTFSPTTIAVSCKSGESKSLSPAREIFYLRGVLDYLRAGNGVVAFARKPVPPHLRDLGRRLDVLVLSGNEVEAWCNSLRNGLPNYGYFQDSAYNEYLGCWACTENRGLSEYLRTNFWFNFDFRNLQNVIIHLRKLSLPLTGQDAWHTLVVLDTAALFCLTVFDLCRQISLLGISAVSEITAAYLFGGSPSFKSRRDLYARVHDLLASTGVLSPGGPSLPPLEPPYTHDLAELALRFIDRPHAAVMIPEILQDAFWRRLGASGAQPLDNKNFLAAEKLTQDLLDFLKGAGGLTWIPKI